MAACYRVVMARLHDEGLPGVHHLAELAVAHPALHEPGVEVAGVEQLPGPGQAHGAAPGPLHRARVLQT